MSLNAGRCKARVESFQKMSDKPPVSAANGGRLERLQSAPAIQFKGSGWYVQLRGAEPKGG